VMNLEQVLNRWQMLKSRHRFGLLFFSLLLTIGGSTLLAELGLLWVHRLLIQLNLLVLLSIVKGRWVFRASLLFFTLSLLSSVISTVSEI